MLGRPHQVAPLMESLRATVPDARVLWCLSPDDHEVHRAVDGTGCERIVVPYQPRGDYARKINHGYRLTTQPLVFTGAGDLVFHPGWFEAAAAELRPGVGVVGVNDLGSPRVVAGEHATHFLVTRTYADEHGTIDERGKIFHEGYPHEFVDDELVATAKRRGMWAMAIGSHVEHLHPNWGKGQNDGLYAAQPTRMRLGRPIYRRRQRLWA